MMETIKERKCQVITKPLLHIIFKNTGLDLYAQGVNWFMALLFIIFLFRCLFSKQSVSIALVVFVVDVPC